MKKMNDQNPRPNTPRKIQRIPAPRSPDAARARAVSHLAVSKWSVDGSGSSVAAGIEHVDEGACGIFASKPQEYLLQPLRPGLRAREQLRHRPFRPNHAALN